MEAFADGYQQHTQQNIQTQPYSNAERQKRYREKKKADKMNACTTLSQSSDEQTPLEQPQHNVRLDKRQPQSSAERQRKYRKSLREKQQMEDASADTSRIHRRQNVDPAERARKQLLNKQRQRRFRERQRLESPSTSSDHQNPSPPPERIHPAATQESAMNQSPGIIDTVQVKQEPDFIQEIDIKIERPDEDEDFTLEYAACAVKVELTEVPVEMELPEYPPVPTGTDLFMNTFPDLLSQESSPRNYAYNPNKSSTRLSHNVEQYCDICNVLVTNENVFEYEPSESPEKPLLCDNCKDSTLNNVSVDDPAEKPYQCQTCQKRFPQRRALTRHKRLHTLTKQFACKVCDKSFKFKHDVARHMKVHAVELPFQCETCLMKFKLQSALNTHKYVYSHGRETLRL